MATGTSRDIIVRGLGVLGRGIRQEPRLFAVAVCGSVLFSLLIIVNAYVVGWVVGDIAIPAMVSG
ncbi:MAG: ABC transporter ATP-binding protein, partial [Micromonosporaceae bacterium]